MTIRRGQTWGRPHELRGDEPVARTDAELTDLARSEHVAPIRLLGGDLHLSMGGRTSPTPHSFPIDLIEVLADDETAWAAAHVVARGPRWSGPFLVAMNATHHGGWNLGPRAHPNDGLMDITVGSLGVSDRWKARRRVVSGSHVPHPGLTERRVGEYSACFDQPRTLYVDGVRRGDISALRLVVHPDATDITV